MEPKRRRFDWANDLVLPTLLFAALGGMNWAVRGTRGLGGSVGCIFAGVLWGIAWWFCAREPKREQSRRYASGWVVLALTFGICLAGSRGWRQWSHFFTNQLFTNFREQEFVPISSTYGFVWLFIAGVPWAGLGACFLAWCGSLHETRVWHWVARIALGLGAGTLARLMFERFPQYFLPLYSTIEDRYRDFDANPDLRRVINDCRDAVVHMGYYLGFLLFEVLRRDWKNVVLILTVGVLNGVGWALLQNWEWAPSVWKDANFAWWRCWESTGGVSIGIAYGIAYFLVNRKMSEPERSVIAARRAIAGPNFEWLLVFTGLAALLGIFAGPTLGWRGSVGLSRLNLQPDIGEFLQRHFDAWGNIYFALVMLFAAAYYFMYRRTTVEEPKPRLGWLTLFTNVEWGALCLVAAFVAPLFAGREIQQWVAKLPGLEAYRDVSPRRLDVIFQFRLIYIGVVTLCGVGWYFIRRKAFDEERVRSTPVEGDPNLERLGAFLGVLAGLAVSLVSGLTGWFQTYRGLPNSVGREVWNWLGPAYLLILLTILAWTLFRPRRAE